MNLATTRRMVRICYSIIWFSGRAQGGRFVEVGAFDGVTFSNSLFFEARRNWSGLCVEPNPVAFAKCQAARRSPCVNAAISQREGTAEFLQVEGQGAMLSGLTDNMDDRHHRRVARDSERQARIPVRTTRLDVLLREHDLNEFDLLMIDVVGRRT